MNKIHIIISSFFMLCLMGCVNNQRSDLQRFNINGKVKSITIESYCIETDSIGNVINRKLCTGISNFDIWSDGRIDFNNDGNISNRHVGVVSIQYDYENSRLYSTLITKNGAYQDLNFCKYDKNGNLLEYTLENGRFVLKYDEQNQLLSSVRTYNFDDGGSVNRNREFEELAFYDSSGLMMKSHNKSFSESTYHYSYDNNRNLIKVLMKHKDYRNNSASRVYTYTKVDSLQNWVGRIEKHYENNESTPSTILQTRHIQYFNK